MKDEGEDAAKVFDENLRYQLKFLDYAPILHISAATGERTPKLLEIVDKVRRGARTRVPTGELNRFIEKITTRIAAGDVRASATCACMYAAQTGVAPPTFVLFTNSRAKLHFSYERFLENRLRESYGFFGNPIRIQVRGRKDSRKGEERKTAAERAPDRRKPVKKGPGSKPTNADRRASQARRGAKRSRALGGLYCRCPRWLHQNASCSRPRTSAKSCRFSRTCCGRGRRSFRRSARCRPAADRVSTAAPTSSWCCASSSSSSKKA